MAFDELAFTDAATAFRRFFVELREGFLEREALFTQIELGLLCKEHVLIIGPPGTAKSAVASAVLGRITDEKTGRPSLFSKQIVENTVQTDLIGPVDFKVLTETGRTEYLTDDGMLGAVHAFLDEVFDGRDMLLRSILNVLHERELKHGAKVTPGRTECALMTSNRYLTEVLQRSPETLQAFADRISFICFCPKSFARKSSRAQMLARASEGQRVALSQPLTLQQLDVLQDAVSRVEVSGSVTEGLELLADALEKELLAQVVKLPDYVPTKYFSQRSIVKALWCLKAAVVRDRIYRRPERALRVVADDLEMLKYFFLLGGPPPPELDALLKGAVDPRERAQLEIIRVEAKAFDEALGKVRPGLDTSAAAEANELLLKEDAGAAEAQTRGWQPAVASTTAKSLKDKLVPGPRHPQNRVPLLTAARHLMAGMEQRIARGMAGQGEGRSGIAVLASFAEVFELVRSVPELQPQALALAKATVEFCVQASQMTALTAEGTEYDDSMKLENLTGFAANLSEELSKVVELLQTLALSVPKDVERGRAAVTEARGRVAAALKGRAARTFEKSRTRRADPLEALSLDSRRLRELETALVELAPQHRGLRQKLLAPLGEAYAKDVIGQAPFARIEQLSRTVQGLIDNLRKEGCAVDAAMAAVKPALVTRLKEHARGLSEPAKVQHPEVTQVLSGEAYMIYKQQLAAAAPEGELASLIGLEGSLVAATPRGERYLPPDVRDAVAVAELTSLGARIRFLRAWLSQLLGSLPAPEELNGRADADHAFDKLVKSRFPMLATKEGELVRLSAAVQRLTEEPAERGEQARKLDVALRGVAEDFAGFSKRLLEARASR